MAIDNDDGRSARVYLCLKICVCMNHNCSGYFDTHHNVLVYKAIDAAYGGASLKSDFGGHSNHHHHNIDLFFSKGFSICGQLEVSALLLISTSLYSSHACCAGF